MHEAVTRAEAMMDLETWTAATFLQAGRLEETATRILDSYRRGDPFNLRDHIFRSADSALFVFSLHRARTAASFVVSLLPDALCAALKGAISTLEAASPELRSARNIVAHYDEYLRGEGRLQRGGTRPEVGYSYETSVDGDMAIMVRFDAETDPLRVEVQPARDAVLEIHRTAREAVNSYYASIAK